MPVVTVPSGPATTMPKAASGPAAADAATEAATPFASVLEGRIKGAPESAGSAAATAEAAAPADTGTDPVPDDLAALLPVFLGITPPGGLDAEPSAPALADGRTQGAIESPVFLPSLSVPAGTPAAGEFPAATPPATAVSLPRAGIDAVAGETTNSPANLAAPGEPEGLPLSAARAARPGAETVLPAAEAASVPTEEAVEPRPGTAAAPTDALLVQTHGGPHTGARLSVGEARYHVASPVGSRPWEAAIGNSLVFMTGQQQSRAEIVLTPPQLGRIEISLTINAANDASATFVSTSPAVQEALTQALPRLKEILADAGINLSQADVNSGSPDRSAGQDGGSSRRATTAEFGGDSAALTSVTDTGWSGTGRGLVDVFA